VRHLRARLRGRSRSAAADPAVTVRRAYPDDLVALDRLAALDGVHVPDGPILLAEVGDDLRAALSLPDGIAVADPFYPTGELVELLRARAAELGA
jgi:hypothetical protein